jgi:hypothetical protein
MANPSGITPNRNQEKNLNSPIPMQITQTPGNNSIGSIIVDTPFSGTPNDRTLRRVFSANSRDSISPPTWDQIDGSPNDCNTSVNRHLEFNKEFQEEL